MMNIKTGWKTSEFWLALISQVVGILVLFQLINGEDAEPLIEALGNLVIAIFGLVAVLPQIVTAVYVWGRATLKRQVVG